jgi:hypothetical protein
VVTAGRHAAPTRARSGASRPQARRWRSTG